MPVMGLANLVGGNYGQQFLQTMSSVYPGYHATRSVTEVIVGTLHGAVDGLIGGAVFVWLSGATDGRPTRAYIVSTQDLHFRSFSGCMVTAWPQADQTVRWVFSRLLMY